MAARPAAKPTPSSVIDLIISDDEDNRSSQAQSTQSPSNLTKQFLQNLPTSNHGLILPGTFDFVAKFKPKGNLHNGNHRISLPMCQAGKSLGATHLESRLQAVNRSETNSSEATSNRRSTEQSLSRKPEDRRTSAEGHAAKRRKNDVGLQISSLPVVAPARNVLATGTHRLSSMPPAILPPAKYKEPELSKSQFNISRIYLEGHTENTVPTPKLPTPWTQRASSATQPTSVPLAKSTVSLTARLEADKTRVSLDGRIQKPQHLPTRTANVVPKDQGKHLTYVLKNQVFKYIRPATDQYRSSISSVDRIRMGIMTATKLVGDPGFIKNLEENDYKLSSDYERKLSFQAQAHVDESASAIISKSSAPGDLSKFEDKLEIPGATSFVDSPKPDDLNNMNDSLLTPSSASDAEDDVFENPPATSSSPPTHTGTTRQYSSSPTTSFSLDKDGISAMDIDIHDESKPPPTVSVRHGSRKPRSSARNPGLEYVSGRQVGASASGHPSDLEQVLKPNLDAIHEVQALRLAGADKSTPRPYVSFRARENIQRGCEIAGRSLSRADRDLLEKSVFHVDFCSEELDFLCKFIQVARKDKRPPIPDLRSQVIALMSGQGPAIPSVISVFEKEVKKPGTEVARILLRRRDTAAIDSFLHDAVEGKIAYQAQISQIESIPRRRKAPPRPPISALLRQREVYGMAPFRVRRGQQSLNIEVTSNLEDTLTRKSEWTDCCGDISTISWTSDHTFICGATAHSDYHNMQYNKPGNLLVGSTTLDTLTALSNHRILRPRISKEENAENALESMRQTQDPWLYTSVVATSHSEVSGYTFSASFDHTVKVWKVSPDGTMDLRGVWYHDGKVNFVVTSDHHERVATASDVSSSAIRVYNFDEEDITNTPYDTYCGDKAREQAQETFRTDTWAYFPATIQWGKSPGVVNFLLVGYSPRSITAHEIDIPEDKKNSGELCLWDVEIGTKIPISSAKTQNVFEVMWHPTQPCFLAATSPCGNFEPEIRTQIRLFAQNETGSFLHIKALDCPAFDINELTIMPNSCIECYVTASCTDGNTYVWDTAQGDNPIHTLGHGESLDNPIHDLPREIADTGVKFASWGKTVDRFYTGSSDGKVKAWDLRKPKGHAFVRTVLSVSGGISAGAFSKNFSKLLIGDATGKVHYLEVDDSDPNSSEEDSKPSEKCVRGPGMPTKIPLASTLPTKRPKVIIPHPEPDPPPGFERKEELNAQDMALQYLEKGHLTLHPDRGIGAVQGPNYAETLLFCYEAHKEADGTLPLLPEWQAKQRFEIQRKRDDVKLARLPQIKSSNRLQHAQNLDLDFEFSRLSLTTQQELIQDGVDLDFEPKQNFELDLLPRSTVFKEHGAWQKRTHNI